MRRSVFIFASICFLFPGSLVYSAVSAGDGLDALRYIELRVLAVDVDVMLPLGWAADDKEMLKTTANQALSDLSSLKNELSGLDLPEDIEPVRAYHLESIKHMENLYNNIDQKSPEQIDKEYTDIRAFEEQGNRNIEPIYKKYMGGDKVPDDFDALKEETRFVSSKEDAEIYMKTIEHIKKREFKNAYDLLKTIEPKYKDSPFEMVILLRQSDCLLSAEDFLGNVEGGETALQKIVDSKIYSPVLAESFIKWRSVFQANNHGMSNMSAIPNKEYNAKRWGLVQAIKEYLKTNPSDLWAQTQIKSLLAYPNIGRGGDYGNDNLTYYGSMYMDLSEKVGEKK